MTYRPGGKETTFNPDNQQHCDWNGKWDTKWGLMRLRQSGNSVKGRYVHDKGCIKGTVSRNKLKGIWHEVPSNPHPDVGDVELTMAADCKSFNGNWRYGSKGGWNGDWPGTRVLRGVIIVSPEDEEILYITSTPKMPTIIFKAEIIGATSEVIDSSKFSWEGVLSCSWKSRKRDRNTKKWIPITDSKAFPFKVCTTGGTWKPNFDIIMGGDMELTVKTTIDGEVYSDNISIKILGKNPDKEIIKAELGDLKYEILAYRETVADHGDWIQFSKGLGDPQQVPEGEPVYGPPAGYGLMQLDPATYEHLWNWKANIKAGKEHLDEDLKSARKLSNYIKKYYNGEEPVTDLTEDEILTQAFYAYNAGRAYRLNGKWHTYYVWDKDNNTWIKNRNAKYSGVQHADKAMNNYYIIKRGETLPGW